MLLYLMLSLVLKKVKSIWLTGEEYISPIFFERWCKIWKLKFGCLAQIFNNVIYKLIFLYYSGISIKRTALEPEKKSPLYGDVRFVEILYKNK